MSGCTSRAPGWHPTLQCSACASVFRRLRRNLCDIPGIVPGLPTIGWHQSLAYRLSLSGRWAYAGLADRLSPPCVGGTQWSLWRRVRNFACAALRSIGTSTVPCASQLPTLTRLVLPEGASRHLHPKTAKHVRIDGCSSSQQRRRAEEVMHRCANLSEYLAAPASVTFVHLPHAFSARPLRSTAGSTA